jgi:cyclic beta-1,2-glucan synthetase
MWRTGWLSPRGSRAVEKPLRDELLSIEGLEERALALAARFTIDPNPHRRARDTFQRFEDNVRVLRAAYRTLSGDVRRGYVVASGANWLLDNFYLVASEMADIRRNLPRSYSRSLPALASREHAGHARIYAIAEELIRHSDSRLEQAQLIAFLNGYQRVAPLTIGELWAWPSMLKLALIENLRRLADELLSARAARGAADAYITTANHDPSLPELPSGSDPAFIVQLLHRVREYGRQLAAVRTAVGNDLESRHLSAEDTIRGEHQRQGVAQVSMANAVTSLRLCATLDWREYVEAVSLVERVLRRDPAGA